MFSRAPVNSAFTDTAPSRGLHGKTNLPTDIDDKKARAVVLAWEDTPSSETIED